MNEPAELLVAFQRHCSQLDRGVGVNESNEWLMRLLEGQNVEPCLWICGNVLAASSLPSTPGSSLFIASKLLHTVLRAHLDNPQIPPLLPSQEVLLGAVLGNCGGNVESLLPSPSQKQLCLCLATLILSELSRATSVSQATSPVLQQLVNVASQSHKNLIIFNTVMSELPNELRVFSASSAVPRRVAAVRTVQAVVAIVKPLVLSSLSLSLTVSNVDAVVSSTLECLSRWCACSLSSSAPSRGDAQFEEDDNGGDDDDDDDDDENGDGAARSGVKSVISLADLMRTPTLWGLLLELGKYRLAAACMNDDIEIACRAASDSEALLQLLSELAIFHSPSSAHVATYSEAARQTSFSAACGVIQLFLGVAEIWDGILAQSGGLAHWSRELFLGCSTKEAGRGMIALPRNLCVGDDGASLVSPSVMVTLVELTSLLAERHHAAIFGPDAWYVECRAAISSSVSGFPNGAATAAILADGSSAASTLMACLLASLAFPELTAAISCTEVLTYLPTNWSRESQPALEASVGPMLTILAHQLALPPTVGQRQAIEFEMRRRAGTSSLAGSTDDVDGDMEEIWRVFHDLRKESEALLQKLVTHYPGGERIVMSVFGGVQQGLDALKAALGAVSAGMQAQSTILEQRVREVECLLFIWLCLAEGCMELDLSGLLCDTPTSPPPTTAHPRFTTANQKHGGKAEQALRLLQMSVEITARIEALGVTQLFPMLQLRCLHLWSVLPEAVGFLGTSVPLAAAAATASSSTAFHDSALNSAGALGPPATTGDFIDLQSVLRLVCSGGSGDSVSSARLALEALVALTGEGGGLRDYLIPYASSLCDWLVERIGQLPGVLVGATRTRSGAAAVAEFAAAVATAQSSYAEKLYLCLGRLVSFIPQPDARGARVSATLTALLVQLEQAGALAGQGQGSGGEEGLATCVRHLASLQGFIRGLNNVAMAADPPPLGPRSGILGSFAPHLYAGLFSMLEALSVALLTVPHHDATSELQQQQRKQDDQYADALASLRTNVSSVICRLLDTQHTEGAVAEAIGRLRQLFFASLRAPQGASMRTRPSSSLAGLAVVLIRQSSDYELRLLEPAWELAAVVLAGLQCFNSLSRPDQQPDGDSDECLAYAVECLCLVRQMSLVQPALLGLERAFDSSTGAVTAGGGEVAPSSLLRAFFSVLRQFLQGFLGGSFEFHANFMRSVNSTLSALHLLPAELQACLCQALHQSGSVELLTTLIAGTLLQVSDARLVKHYAIFFEATALIASQQDGALTTILGEACQRLGAAHAQPNAVAGEQGASMNFYAALYHHLVQASLPRPGSKVRTNLSSLRKWVGENKPA